MTKTSISVPTDMVDFIFAILKEKERAENKFPVFIDTLPDAALVIGEEVGEVQQAVLKYFYEGGNFGDIAKEVTEVACTALRTLQFIREQPIPQRRRENERA